MSEPTDLQYIGAVLSGARGASGRSAQDGRRQAGRRSASAAGVKRRRPEASSSKQRSASYGAAGSGTSGGAAASQPAHPDAAAAAAGGPGGAVVVQPLQTDAAAAAPAGPSSPAGSSGSSKKGRECVLCGCWVGGGARGWDTHVAGIQHRRQALSVRETGEPGHVICSVFENTPQAADRHSRRQQHAAAVDATGLPPGAEEALQRLLRELIHHCSSTEYSKLAGRATVQALRDSWNEMGSIQPEAALFRICSSMEALQLLLIPAAAAARGDMHLDIHVLCIASTTKSPLLAAAVAGLGATAVQMPCHWQRISLSLCGGSSDVAPLSLERALCRFLAHTAEVIPAQGPNLGLVELSLDSAPTERLKAACCSFVCAVADSMLARRGAFVAGLHRRAEAAGSPVAMLPAPLVAEIARRALPLQPVQLRLKLHQWDMQAGQRWDCMLQPCQHGAPLACKVSKII